MQAQQEGIEHSLSPNDFWAQQKEAHPVTCLQIPLAMWLPFFEDVLVNLFTTGGRKQPFALSSLPLTFLRAGKEWESVVQCYRLLSFFPPTHPCQPRFALYVFRVCEVKGSPWHGELGAKHGFCLAGVVGDFILFFNYFLLVIFEKYLNCF